MHFALYSVTKISVNFVGVNQTPTGGWLRIKVSSQQESQEHFASNYQETSPLRKVKVLSIVQDVWARLAALDSGLSMADWTAMDKSATRDVQAGTRFLLGQSRSSKAVDVYNLSLAATMVVMVKLLTLLIIRQVTTLICSRIFLNLITVAGYSYSYDDMKRSKPFKAPVEIGNSIINAMLDTGAILSIISGNLARN
ncbi:unnamed protein product [Absidia cylindrospora]